MSNFTEVYGGRAVITFNEGNHTYYVSVPSLGVKRLYQPSVTSILDMKDKSKALTIWAVDAFESRALELIPTDRSVTREEAEIILDAAKDSYRRIKAEAANVGSIVHRVLHQLLLSRAGLAEAPRLPLSPDLILSPDMTPELIEKANNCISAGQKFFTEHRIQPVQAEAPRWSPTYGYVGTGDLIARVDGDLSALDYKSGKRLYETVFLQLAAYQMAYEEEFPDQKIKQRWAVNVGRDGELATECRDNSTLEYDFACFRGLLGVWRWNQENQGKYSKPAPKILGPLV
jgi:hypothetical protein